MALSPCHRPIPCSHSPVFQPGCRRCLSPQQSHRQSPPCSRRRNPSRKDTCTNCSPLGEESTIHDRSRCGPGNHTERVVTNGILFKNRIFLTCSSFFSVRHRFSFWHSPPHGAQCGAAGGGIVQRAPRTASEEKKLCSLGARSTKKQLHLADALLRCSTHHCCSSWRAIIP